MNKLLGYLFIVFGVFGLGSWTIPEAHAEHFTVRTKVLCPGYFKTVATSAPGGAAASVTVFDPYLNASNVVPELVPCAHIKVEARDADVGRDDFCGSGYANLNGEVEFSANCGDFLAGRPDVYLQIYAKSAHGWEITKYDGWEAALRTASAVLTVGILGDLTDAATSHDPYKVTVTSQKHPHSGDTLTYGTISLGDDGDSIRSRREFVGSLFFISDVTVRSLKAIGYDSPLISDTNWVIDSIIGTPSTVWKDIVLDESKRSESFSDVRHTLRSAPHEFGHVFHNKRHSGEYHWYYTDALTYMHNHDSCSDHGTKFAWYEGFANFVRDIVFDGQSVTENSVAAGTMTHKSLWDSFRIESAEAVCARKTSRLEGNVEAVLADLYFGNFEGQTEIANGVFDASRLNSDFTNHQTQAIIPCVSGLQDVSTFKPKTLMNLIRDAREDKSNGSIADNHSFYDYWLSLVNGGHCNSGYCRSETLSNRSAKVLPYPIGFSSTQNCKNSQAMTASTNEALPDSLNSADISISKRAATNLITYIKQHNAERLKIVPLKDTVKKADPKVDTSADWFEFGIDLTHIADEDFAAELQNAKVRFDIAPHVVTTLKWQLANLLNREPTSAELKNLIDQENAKVVSLNKALYSSAEYRKAAASQKRELADAVEDKILANEMGYSKPAGDEAPTDQVLTEKERRQFRTRLFATLINEKYDK